MPTIKFIVADGREIVVEARNGETVMQIAVDNLVPGIAAECGGACSCATCRVMLSSDWLAVMGPAEDMEKDLIESQGFDLADSRLGCQIEITQALDGLCVVVPV